MDQPALGLRTVPRLSKIEITDAILAKRTLRGLACPADPATTKALTFLLYAYQALHSVVILTDKLPIRNYYGSNDRSVLFQVPASIKPDQKSGG